MEGWIKLHRAVLDHWVFKDKEAWQIWCYCLMDATHTRTHRKVKGRIVELYPGQTVFGRNEWSRLLNIDANKVYRTVQAFVDAGMVQLFTVKGQYSVLALTNWHEYQGERVNSKRTAEEQEMEQAESAENKASEDEEEQEDEQQMNSKRTHNKNVKNAKKSKDIIYTASESEILTCWNSHNIIVHQPTALLKKAIATAIKTHGMDTILEAIGNYSKVHAAHKTMGYFYSHKWALDKFLKQKNGVLSFVNGGEKQINFESWLKEQQKKTAAAPSAKKPTNCGNFEQREYDENYFDNLYEN